MHVNLATPFLAILLLLATSSSTVCAYSNDLFEFNRNTFFKEFAYKYSVSMSLTARHYVSDAGFVEAESSTPTFTAYVENGVVTSHSTPIAKLIEGKPLLANAAAFCNKSIEMAFEDVFGGIADHVQYDNAKGFPKHLQYEYGPSTGLVMNFISMNVLQKDADKVELSSNWQAAWNTWESKRHFSYTFVVEEYINRVLVETKVVYVNHGVVSDVRGHGRSANRTYGVHDASTIGQYFSQIRMKAIVLGMHNRTWVNFDFKEGYPADWHYVEISLGNLGVGGEVLKEHQFRISSFEPGEHHPDDINKTEINWMVAGIVVVIVVGIVFTLGFFAYRFYYIRKMKKRNEAYVDSDSASNDHDSDRTVDTDEEMDAVPAAPAHATSV